MALTVALLRQVRVGADFTGLGDIAAISGAELLPVAAVDFLDSLVQVGRCALWRPACAGFRIC